MRSFLLPAILSLAGLMIAPAVASAACAGRDLLADTTAPDVRSLAEAAEAQPYATGNHWRATRGDTVIDLIGTMHVFDPRMEAAVERLAPVIEAADALYLEATSVEMARIQSEIARDPALMFITDGPTLPELLAEADWQALAAQMRARGIPAFFAAKFRPWYAAIMLSMPGCSMPDLAAKREGLDLLIEKKAAGAGVPAHPLEPYDTVFRLFSAIPEAEQVAMIPMALPYAKDAEDQMTTLTEAYFREEHRIIWEMARAKAREAPGKDPGKMEAEFAQMEKLLLTDRNAHWIEELLPLAPDAKVVVAVGAAHLSGESGLLRLLEKQGFNIERQSF